MEILSSLRLTSCSRVREKVGCRGNFPEVYDKVNRRGRTGKQREIELISNPDTDFYTSAMFFVFQARSENFKIKSRKNSGNMWTRRGRIAQNCTINVNKL